jgi:ornithine cyclodeaminase/alanine dehydrogenase-like protein (mu-crystallin family)
MRVLFLSHADVVAALPPAECEEAMAAVLAARARGEAHMPLRSVMAPPGAAGFMGLMPAWRRGPNPVFSLKTVCIIPGNPARGLDAHQGTVTLYDGDTGMPTAVLDASAVTQIRTAAVSAVATRLLAREDARVLAIIGAGVQARAHIESLRLTRPFERIRIFSRTEAHAREVAAEATAREVASDATAREVAAAPDVIVAPSAEDAVRGADVVVLATSSREPVLERGWLAPGTHVNAVGASMPAARELDVETLVASALFADSRESLRNEAGEFLLAVEQGRIAGEDHVRAELGEVIAGIRPGRLDDDELTLFRSLGLAVEDLAAAEHAVAAARRGGLGVEVKL